MKKTIILIAICILLASFSITHAISIKDTFEEIKTFDNKDKTKDTPNWATGEFKGTWGIREYTLLFGMVEIEIGNISGYYREHLNFIRVIGGEFYPHYNTSKKSNITGINIGSVIYGNIGDINIENIDYDINQNKSNYVGIGLKNESSFNYRIMGKTGPTMYIKGSFNAFE